MFGFNGEFNPRFPRFNKSKNDSDPRQKILTKVKQDRETRLRNKIIEMAANKLTSVIISKQSVRRIKQENYDEFSRLWAHTPRHENLCRLTLLFFAFYADHQHQDTFNIFHSEISQNPNLLVSKLLCHEMSYLIGKVVLAELGIFSRTRMLDNLTLTMALINPSLYSTAMNLYGSILHYSIEKGLFGIINEILSAETGSSVFPRVYQIIKYIFSVRSCLPSKHVIYYFVKDLLVSVSRGIERMLVKMATTDLLLSDHVAVLHTACIQVLVELSNNNILTNYNNLINHLLKTSHCSKELFLSYASVYDSVLLKFFRIHLYPTFFMNLPLDSFMVAVENFVSIFNEYVKMFKCNVILFATLYCATNWIGTRFVIELSMFDDLDLASTLFYMAAKQLCDFVNRFCQQPFCQDDPFQHLQFESFHLIYTSVAVISRLWDSILLDCDVPENIRNDLLFWASSAIKFYFICGFKFLNNHDILELLRDNHSHVAFVIETEIPRLIRDIYLWDRRLVSDFDWSLTNLFINQINLYDLVKRGPEIPLMTFNMNYPFNQSESHYPVDFLIQGIALVPRIYPLSHRSSVIRLIVPNDSHHRSVEIGREKMYQEAFSFFQEDMGLFIHSLPRIVFINDAGAREYGTDGGGLRREFLINILEYAFSPSANLFVECNVENRALFPNPMSIFYLSVRNYFFIGLLVAWAITMDIVMPGINLSCAFWQHMVYPDSHLGINWLSYLDSELYRNLISLRTLECLEDLNLNFTIQLHTGDGSITRYLKPNGDSILVTKENVEEYIELYAGFRLTRSVFRQVSFFRDGFTSVIQQQYVSLFDADEIQYLFSGDSDKFDFDDFKNNVIYEGGYNADSCIIERFWSVFYTFTDNEARNLLKFATSYSAAPRGGFKNLYPNFCITCHSYSQDMHLPTATTCYNVFCLPPYSSYEIMREKLLYVVHAHIGFELY